MASDPSPSDNIYSVPRAKVGDFVFDDAVADVFPDMIQRSVPGYGSVLSMIEQLTMRFAQPYSRLYDLGCSLGAATLLMRKQAPQGCVLHAIDSSAAMVMRLRRKLEALRATEASANCQVEVHQADVRGFPLRDASMVVCNWTLQFIPREEREPLLHAIAAALRPGGALLLSEKIAGQSVDAQRLLVEMHHDFKRSQGYSELEIAQKRQALENTLIPESMAVHCERLERAGFSPVVPWFQCFNFASILAIKPH